MDLRSPRAKEGWRGRLRRWGFNLVPAWRGTGGRIAFLADDWSEVRVRLPLSWRTRNYVGTIFGGSMYGAVDPIYMIMLIKRLGPGYQVWDKAARIRFRRPGRSTLHARFVLEDDEVRDVLALLEASDRVERTYTVELTDEGGVVHAHIEKLIHIRRKA